MNSALVVRFNLILCCFSLSLSSQTVFFGPDQGSCQGRNMVWNSSQSTFLFFGTERSDANAQDAFVSYQVDTALNVLSSKRYLFPGPAFPGTIEPLPNGAEFLGCGGYYLPSGNSVGVLIWFDAQGDTIKSMEFPVFFGSSSIKRSSIGPQGKIGFVGYRTSGQNNSSDIWIGQLDSLGNLEWERTLGGPLNDVGHGIRWHSGKQAWAISGDFETSSYGNYLAFIDGQGQWLKDSLISDANANGNYVLEIDDAGRIFMSGESTTNSGPAFDIFLVSTSTQGDVNRWGYFGGTGTEAGFSLICTPDDSLLVSGYSTSFYPGLPINPYIIKMDKSFSGGRYSSLNFPSIGISYGLLLRPNGEMYASGSLNQRHFIWKVQPDSLRDLEGRFSALLQTDMLKLNSDFPVWNRGLEAWEINRSGANFSEADLQLLDIRGTQIPYSFFVDGEKISLQPRYALQVGLYFITSKKWRLKAFKP